MSGNTERSGDRRLSARMPYVESRRRPQRLVIVDDPEVGLVVVWWDLGRPAMWRCTVHGRMASPGCAHIDAAVTVLAAEIFGQYATPAGEETAGAQVKPHQP